MPTKNITEIIEFLEKYTIEEIKEAIEEKELIEMKKLGGKRVEGFLLSMRTITSNKGTTFHDYIFADKSIKKERCLLNIGRVFSLDEARLAIKEKMAHKIEKNKKWEKFLRRDGKAEEVAKGILELAKEYSDEIHPENKDKAFTKTMSYVEEHGN